jgi:hypothetical protein
VQTREVKIWNVQQVPNYSHDVRDLSSLLVGVLKSRMGIYTLWYLRSDFYQNRGFCYNLVHFIENRSLSRN